MTFFNYKPITKIEGISGDLYKISDKGEVYSNRYKVLLKPSTNNSGYKYVILNNKGVKKSTLIHRLVALHFLTPVENMEEVNHKDENKLNNCLSNLEWSNRKLNMNHGTVKERKSKALSKPVLQFDLQNNFIREFKSALEPQKLGLASSAIYSCLINKQKTHRGFIWKYKN